MSKLKVLIIGSEGFIGRNLVPCFQANNYEVFGCDRIESNSPDYHYTNVSTLSDDAIAVFKGVKYTVCINASGSGTVANAINDPVGDFEINTYSVARILNYLKDFQPGCKFIHISSAAVYGNPLHLPVTETSEIVPLSGYGFNKWMSEIICRQYYDLYKIPIAILRPFSVYGNGLKKQLIWDICTQLKFNDKLTLFGTGNESRDYIHISDLCNLIIQLTANGNFGADVYNAATGNETTIREIAEKIIRIYKPGTTLIFSGKIKEGDPVNWRADISKAEKIGYKPAVSIDEGLNDYVNWFDRNG